MRILIFNWRDIKNPAGGGAEILTHEMAKRWVSAGNIVDQFCSSYPHAKSVENIDGVRFIRKGKWWTVHILGFFYYLTNKTKYDVIIDEVHWFPFFSAIYAPSKTIALTCEVASKLLFRVFPYPVALVFLMIEKMYLYLYRKVPTMVISPSTRDDLLQSGHEKKLIEVIPMGITLPKNIRIKQKEKNVTIISVGRLNKQKGTLEVVQAFALIKREFPEAKLWLVGSAEGAHKGVLLNTIKSLGLQSSVKIWGFVDEEKKFSLMSRAHVLVSASAQEGWGLTIPEAGLVKTPSVVYNIPGFRDIIVQHSTGILVNTNHVDLAHATVNLLANKNTYNKIQKNGYEYYKKYTWDATALSALEFIKHSLQHNK